MAGEELKQLIAKRGYQKGSITRTKTFVDKFNTGDNINQLKSRLPNLRAAFKEFTEIQLQIELLDASDKQIKERNEFEEFYYAVETQILTHIETAEAQSKTKTVGDADADVGATGTRETRVNPLRLPVLDLPTFTGNYLHWTAFADTFKTLIHDSKLYTKIEKFHYLKSCLKGDAQKAIESFTVSEANYETAWKMLAKRFENTLLIIQEHVLAILNSPVITKNSHTAVRKLLDDISINIEALKTLKQEVDKWDALIVPIIAMKFDFITKREWETTLSNEVPTLTQLIEFLTKRTLLLESLNASDQSQQFKTQFKQNFRNFNPRFNNNSMPKGQTTCTNVNLNKIKMQCFICKGSHALYHCPEFLNLTIADRLNKIESLNLCKNCFKQGHNTDKCNSSTCRRCNEKHNTLLHSPNEQSLSVPTVVSHSKCDSELTSETLLSTAQILVKDRDQNWVSCRALLDVGSQSNFISQATCNKLQVGTSYVKMLISGINDSQNQTHEITKIEFKSLYSSETYNVNCLVLKRLTQNLPTHSFEADQIQIPSNICLADPKFHRTGEIQILLGAEIFWKVLRTGQLKANEGSIHYQETALGWVVGGKVAYHKPLNSVSCHLSLNALDKQVRKHWEIDQWPLDNKPVQLSQEDFECEKQFLETHKRDSTGRFIVQLPFKLPISNVGNTRRVAEKRFFTLENRFKHNPSFKEAYKHFIDEYSQLGHMEKSTPYEESEIYLPHHAVFKTSSTTSKLRVVFDGSVKSSTDISLNDILAVGQKIQNDLCAIILRFRLYRYVLTGDINKMFRQVLIAPEHRKYQKIIWRNDTQEPLTTYQLNTVTYGTACAPFLAVRCLQQLALENKTEFPDVYTVIVKETYMDDVLAGSGSIEEAINLRKQLTIVLARGGFELRKWAANNERILSDVVCNDNDFENGTINFDKNGESKTLGLFWNCKEDMLRYKVVKGIEDDEAITKRKIVSTISKIFDPLNLIGPVGVKAKILIQEVWKLKLGWDEKLPDNLQAAWTRLWEQLNGLNNIQIQRNVIDNFPYDQVELHGFSDASQQAYGASIYIRTVGVNKKISSNLLCAKSRVAPIKSISIPRLELCAALLLAKLVSSVISNSQIQFYKVYYWTDSSIVLAWLANNACNLNTFVANRVSEIQTLTNISDWRHIKSQDNPADVISRGMLPNELITCSLWFHGPEWLIKPSSEWPASIPSSSEVPEIRKVTLVTINENNIDISVLDKFSSFSKLQRVIATCFRFVANCKRKNKLIGNFELSELSRASKTIFKLLQKIEFAQEISELSTGKQIIPKSKLLNLNPFLDDEGILRVGGRLNNANITYDQKHPIVLPKHHVTKLMIKLEHENQLHAGPNATLAAFRLRFWPLTGKQQVRQVIHKCLVCARFRASGVNPIMGDLPESRITPKRPFLNSGVDFGGPILIKDSKGRSKKTIKSYIALFVCLATKAVHLELVSDLTTESFLNAVKRFVSRRGVVSNIYSDNASNLVGAHNELNTFFKSKEFNDQFPQDLSNKGITWHFIPARAPHFGGIWEAGIKSAKFHLKRVTGNALLTFEEMYTLLTCIEACLNSRPLCPLSEDPSDMEVLTPGHFLIGAPLTAIPEPSVTHIKENRLSRWQRVEALRQHFWNRWSQEYLGALQQRPKWQRKDIVDIKLGDLVLVKENTPPLTWRRGRVVETHPGKDGVTRVVSLKVDNKVIKRAVRTLCVLPVECDGM